MLFVKEGMLAAAALSPPAPCGWVATLQPQLPGLGTVTSIAQLNGIRDRLNAELDRCAGNLTLAQLEPQAYSSDSLELQQEDFLRRRKAVDDRLQQEAVAELDWQAALNAAQQAIASGDVAKTSAGATRDAEIATWRRTQSLWQQAIDRLDRIPEVSVIAANAIQKRREYQGYLAVVSEKLEIAQLGTGFIFYGDTNRDGAIDAKDYKGRQVWTWQSGALMLFNNDDDDGDGELDALDRQVDGDADTADLAPIRLQLTEGFKGSQLSIKMDEKSRPYVNLFQKTDRGWQPIDGTGKEPIQYGQDLTLGVEAKQFAYGDWNGTVTIEAIAQRNGQMLTADRIQMRASPWILSPNTAPVDEFFVSDLGSNRKFVAQLSEIIPQTGAKLNIVPQGPTWMQDTMEIGRVQFPQPGSIQSLPSVLRGNRGMSQDRYARSLLKSNFGWFKMGEARGVGPGLPDWYGNLEVTPPVPGYPLGRFYYGRNGDVTMHPDVVSFLKAQEVQGDPIELDTSWLLIGHVDEIVSFIPTNEGGFLLMVTSPEAGVNLLRELKEKGFGDRQVNRDLSTQTTVNAAVNNSDLIEYNLKLQREHINPIIQKLKQELKLSDAQIIQVPAMYTRGASWWPNMVNSVVVNGHLIASDPKGAIVDDRDLTQDVFLNLVAASGLQVHFVDDLYYHELRGNTHCATNTERAGSDRPFWQQLPDRLK
jgi:protein-arginine deiminase